MRFVNQIAYELISNYFTFLVVVFGIVYLNKIMEIQLDLGPFVVIGFCIDMQYSNADRSVNNKFTWDLNQWHCCGTTIRPLQFIRGHFRPFVVFVFYLLESGANHHFFKNNNCQLKFKIFARI